MTTNLNYVKVGSAIPSVRIADCAYNLLRIKEFVTEAEKKDLDIVCFPELCLTAYTCQDLFSYERLLKEAQQCLLDLTDFTRSKKQIVIVGLPIERNGVVFNCAAVIQSGHLKGLVPKTYLPNYKEFYEKRWFSSASILSSQTHLQINGEQVPLSSHLLFHTPRFTFGVEICEDLWAPIPPGTYQAMAGADIIFNLSADNESIGKHEYLKSLIAQQSARCIAGYVYTGCGYGESTQDVVFTGKTLIYENGNLLSENDRFSLEEQLSVNEIDVDFLRHERRCNTTFGKCGQLHTLDFATVELDTPQTAPVNRLCRRVNATPFIPAKEHMGETCYHIIETQVLGLVKRLSHIQCKHVVIGISGGLDSTLALLVCVRTFDKLNWSRRGILGVTMPGFATTGRTYRNALHLMERLGIDIREISICASVNQHFNDIKQDPATHDVTYENGQARERTQILMDLANKVNGIVVGTGDLSELALGWATYNGDHMSMYNVNVSIPKTLIKSLVHWYSETCETNEVKRILQDIIDTPISPELVPGTEAGQIAQKTEDLVGPYELHDFFLYNFLRKGASPTKIYFLALQAFEGIYEAQTIKKWLKTFFIRFFRQQYKRSCLPDGPKVGSCSLSPRGDWRMSSDCSENLWVEECNNL